MDKKQNYLDEFLEAKPESFQEENFESVRRKPGRIIAVLLSIALVVGLFIFISYLSDVVVPDMKEWQLEDVQTWVSKHHKNTVLKGVFNKEISQNGVISQNISPGTKISKNTCLTINYSMGADPEEVIEIPDIMSMTSAEIKTWISDNRLAGVTTKNEVSETIPKDGVINYELVDGTAEEFQRKNRMIIYLSSGTVNMDDTIKMPDLYGKTRTEILKWSEEQQVKVVINDIFNQDVDYGKVFAQSIEKDTKITRNDTIEVSISRGKSINVPNYMGMTRSEAQELSSLLGISIFFKLVISDEETDSVINQDVEVNSEIDQKQMVTLNIAKKDNNNYVPDFIGLTATEVTNLAGLYGIKVFMENTSEAGVNGVVDSQSISPGRIIDEEQILSLYMKKSNVITVPNFVGLSQNKATELAKKLGIELIINEEETMDSKNKTVISQETKAKKIICKGDTVLLTIAINSGVCAEDLCGKSLKDAKAWATQKGIALNVLECYNREYTAITLYYQDCEEDKWIPSSKTLTMYYSLGPVYVSNFVGKTKADIINWRNEVNSKGANITLSFLEDNNTSKSKGEITKQSITEENVDLEETITVWISSSDNGVLIKSFEGVTIEDFKLWCDANSVIYIINDCYSDAIEKGVLFGQNYTDTYLPENTYLRINHSLGKLYVEDFTNQPKTEFIKWVKEANKMMANVKVEYSYIYDINVPKGNIVYQSIMDTEIGINSTINVVVSTGPY